MKDAANTKYYSSCTKILQLRMRDTITRLIVVQLLGTCGWPSRYSVVFLHKLNVISDVVLKTSGNFKIKYHCIKTFGLLNS